jgi:hypothetical protein
MIALHVFQAIKWRKTICWVIIMGGIWEALGYLLRMLNIHQPDGTPLYILEILILLAPLWVNAFDYLMLSRIVYYFLPGEKIGALRPQCLATTFVCLDIV